MPEACLTGSREADPDVVQVKEGVWEVPAHSADWHYSAPSIDSEGVAAMGSTVDPKD